MSGGGGVAGSLDSQVTCHQLVTETVVATQCFVAIHIALLQHVSKTTPTTPPRLTLLTWGRRAQ